MQKAGGYFFGQGTGRGKPGLNSPPDCKSLDRPKYRVGMHTAKFGRPEDFGYGTLYYHGRKLQFAQPFTRPHKSLSGAPRLLQPGNRVIAKWQLFTLYPGKPLLEESEDVWLLLHAIDDKSRLRKLDGEPLVSKKSRMSWRPTHYFVFLSGQIYSDLHPLFPRLPFPPIP